MQKSLQTSIYDYLENARERARRGRNGNFKARFAEVKGRYHSCSNGFIVGNMFGVVLGLVLGNIVGGLLGHALWNVICCIFFCGLLAVLSTYLLRLEEAQKSFGTCFGTTSWIEFPRAKDFLQLYIDVLWIVRNMLYSRSAVFLDAPATLDVELPGSLRTLDAYGFTTSYHMLCITSCAGMFAL